VAVSFDLNGRVAVVVGGTSGIGRALALGLADAGADVVVTGRRAAMVNEVAAAITARGRRTLRMPTDVTNPAALRALNAACLEEFGAVDIVLFAAGTTKRTPSLDMTDDEWNGILETNLTGMMRTYKAFAPDMPSRRSRRSSA
jgi:NAD(P)-dependent dehydrogenase (short-subunit alcohol dehydrogenase family)